jgi:hypothetical protein
MVVHIVIVIRWTSACHHMKIIYESQMVRCLGAGGWDQVSHAGLQVGHIPDGQILQGSATANAVPLPGHEDAPPQHASRW